MAIRRIHVNNAQDHRRARACAGVWWCWSGRPLTNCTPGLPCPPGRARQRRGRAFVDTLPDRIVSGRQAMPRAPFSTQEPRTTNHYRLPHPVPGPEQRGDHGAARRCVRGRSAASASKGLGDVGTRVTTERARTPGPARTTRSTRYINLLGPSRLNYYASARDFLD
jgi:hypothetical protein